MSESPIIDVERLVEDLRGRVARARAEGHYGDDLSGLELIPPPPEARVRFRPELAYSSKPVVGAPLTAIKRFILRLLVHVFDDLARQTDAAVGRISAEVRAWDREVRDRSQAEAAVRERVQADVAGLARRVDVIEGSLDRLQLAPRLARLERRERAPLPPNAPASPGAPPSATPVAASEQGLDYLAFEARFRGSEDTVRGRQEVYRRDLERRRRVVDLGCGRGELLELLRDAGVDSYGVDTEPDFVELLAEKGIEVRREDAIAHVEGLAPGEVDGIVASHVIEHLPPAVIGRLVVGAAAALPEGGVLILETPNPESLLAGSINFHRDPTHLRPVHPDTLVFLCESAGFREVEVLRLSPVPESERLPSPAPGDDPLARHVDAMAERLNGIVFGWQDYAVIARR